ncbi:MAG: hypothetical protein JJU05_09725 [Verrucomicrobia bacterium]|nr:hypothetical protein [Verrucomicrobiota bacterium]MCH8527573.1 hypothetical protein [Kiritimatiellia bacterium]
MLQNLHALTAAYMTGIIWFVQIIHYPALAPPARGSFVEHHQNYTRRMGLLVGPVMILELILQTHWLLRAPGPAAYTGTALLLLIWISTFALQVPAHTKLTQGYDPALVRTLVRTNWLRTAAWTARSLLLVFI